MPSSYIFAYIIKQKYSDIFPYILIFSPWFEMSGAGKFPLSYTLCDFTISITFEIMSYVSKFMKACHRHIQNPSKYLRRKTTQ